MSEERAWSAAAWVLRFYRLLGPSIVLLLMAASLVSQAAAPYPCAIDEPTWITSGLRTYELVREFAPPSRWATAYDELKLGDYGNKNPPVGKFIFGIVTAAVIEDGERVEYRWRWPLSYKVNFTLGNLPPLRILTPVRMAVALCGALVLMLLYATALVLTGRPWLSLVAPAMTFSMPVFVWHATHVYTDVPQLLFLALGLLAYVRYLRTWKLGALVLAGVALGLSCAVKFSSGPLVGACALATLLLGDQPWRKRAACAVGLCAVALVVFIAVNPYLYPSPVRLMLETVASWNASKRADQEDPLLAPLAVTSALGGIERVARGGVFAPHYTPEYHTRDLDEVAPQLNAAVGVLLLLFAVLRARLKGVARRPRREWLLFGGVMLWALAIELAVRNAPLNPYGLLGGLAVFHLIAGNPEARTSRCFLGLAIGAMFLCTALWLPFDWPRYYLPLIVVLAPAQAAGAAELGRLLDRNCGG